MLQCLDFLKTLSASIFLNASLYNHSFINSVAVPLLFSGIVSVLLTADSSSLKTDIGTAQVDTGLKMRGSINALHLSAGII